MSVAEQESSNMAARAIVIEEKKVTASDHIALVEKFAAHNYHPLPVVVAKAQGVWVEDVEGNRYMDMLAAYSAVNFGHGHAELIAVAKEQLEKVTTNSARSAKSWPSCAAWRPCCP